MLDTFESVERALRHYSDALQASSSSIMTCSSSGSSGADRFPFHPALLDSLEERTELRRRMVWLEPEEREVLVGWYVSGLGPHAVASAMGRSVRHVYRLRRSAIDYLVSMSTAGEFTDVDVAEFA
jgi:DNA-directed RNA polymerase specialized sigma24 family protein